MNILRWDPTRELQQLRAQTEQLWDTFLAKLTHECEGRTTVSFLPDVDVVETDYDYRVFIAVPGLIEEDIDIEAASNSLTVRGERQPPYDPGRRHVREWRYGFFERKLTFQEPVSVNDVRATYDAGVLTVIMSKQNSRVADEG